MNKLVFPLILLIAVILVVSIIYILATTKHREKMAMIEKGLESSPFEKRKYYLDTLRFGMMAMGVGLGFGLAFTIDLAFFWDLRQTEAIYPACIITLGGFSLVLFYKLFHKD